jgi:hypothetical protein
MSYVLTPLTITELRTFFDDEALSVIKYFLKKSIISQPEKLPSQDDLPIQIPKEHIEQWIVQALGATPLGAGSYPVDVITDDWGADVKMLSCKINDDGSLKNGDSGETSLAQKFGDNNFGNGITLDDLFSRKMRHIIWCQWKKILIDKYRKVEEDHAITNIYYFIVLRAGNIFHLCGLKVDLSKLKDTKINDSRSTNDSIWIKEFIDDEFGHIKIYKAKKRLELRLKPKKWIDDNMVISFDTNFEQISVNIREKVNKNELEKYIEDTLLPILKKEESSND